MTNRTFDYAVLGTDVQPAEPVPTSTSESTARALHIKRCAMKEVARRYLDGGDIMGGN